MNLILLISNYGYANLSIEVIELTRRFKNIIIIWAVFSLLLSVFEFEHIFCRNIVSSFITKDGIQEHEHSVCSHHCSDTKENHQKHSKPHDCCDSEEPHDHPTPNPVVSFGDYFPNHLVFTHNSEIDLKTIYINKVEFLFFKPEIESLQLNSIKTVVLII